MESEVFAELIPSTATLSANIENFTCNINDINDHELKAMNNVIKISSNAGTATNKAYVPPPTKPKSNRGRRAVVPAIVKKKRCMDSQIQYSIICPVNKDKIWKIKVFNTGTIHVPGCKDVLFRDAMPVVNYLLKYLKNIYCIHKPLKITNIEAVLRNYKSGIILDDPIINRDHFCNFLNRYINEGFESNIIREYIKTDIHMKQLFPANVIRNRIAKLFPNNSIGVLQLANNIESGPSFISIKLLRPKKYWGSPPVPANKIRKQLDQKTTMKIFKKGLINIVGGKSIREIKDIYNWFKEFVGHYYKFFLENYMEHDLADSDLDHDNISD